MYQSNKTPEDCFFYHWELCPYVGGAGKMGNQKYACRAHNQIYKHKESSSRVLACGGFGWCKKTTLKRVFKKRQTETRGEREKNEYGMESANRNVSPARQRLSLLTGEAGNTCVQSTDH